jgi:hypothetical protein
VTQSCNAYECVRSDKCVCVCIAHDCHCTATCSPYHLKQAAIRAKWDAQNNGSVIDCLNKEFGAFSKSVKKVFIAQVLYTAHTLYVCFITIHTQIHDATASLTGCTTRRTMAALYTLQACDIGLLLTCLCILWCCCV